MGRPRLHDDTTAGVLLDTAEHLVENEGVAALTVRRLADEAGTSARAIYSLYGSMSGLLTALGTRAFRLLAASLEALPITNDRVADVVAAGVDGFRPFAVEHAALFEITFQSRETFAEIRPGIQSEANQAWAPLRARIERLPPRYLLDRTVVQAGYEFHAACEGLAGLEIRSRLTEGFPMAWEDTLHSLVAGWGAPR